jgi:glycosyltransferase involved in cell wall biosynthesis
VQVGSLREETLKLAETLGVRERLQQLSNLPDSDLVMLYNIASVLVFPSTSEGFGWPPLEAMACGCPVIASRCASLPEVCGEACLYANPADAAEIAGTIRSVLSDMNLRQGMVAEGLKQAARFSWKSTAARLLQLLQS